MDFIEFLRFQSFIHKIETFDDGDGSNVEEEGIVFVCCLLFIECAQHANLHSQANTGYPVNKRQKMTAHSKGIDFDADQVIFIGCCICFTKTGDMCLFKINEEKTYILNAKIIIRQNMLIIQWQHSKSHVIEAWLNHRQMQTIKRARFVRVAFFLGWIMFFFFFADLFF